jgi:diadenosine tetraphosphate (Ap4A) HIT family hydrolase
MFRRRVRDQWPPDWDRLVRGIGCPMCEGGRPESDEYGVRIREAEHTDAYLQRADVQRGYAVVIWRGRHVTEPTELSDTEARDYWRDVLTVARALMTYYEPLKMNYETLGNSLPHLHTHLVPRYHDDVAPGRPFPLGRQDGSRPPLPGERLTAEAAALRELLAVRSEG